MLASKYVSVTTTATLLSGADSQYTAGQSVLLKNAGGQTVYLGGSDVTADTTAGTGGYPLSAGAEISVALGGVEKLYGRVAATTANVNVLQQGV